MQLIDTTLSTLEVGTPTTCHNLTLYPLLGKGCSHPDYLTLDEALAQGSAHITEVSEGGSVPDLRFVNESDRPVLLLDGEELVGAKQNRVLNLTLLVPARSTLLIPVSCVEAGRWAHVSVEFGTSGHAHYATGRAHRVAQVSESMRATGARRSDQGQVWSDITDKFARLDSSSPTMAMADIYTQHETRLEDYVQAFAAQQGQLGAVFAIGGEIIGCDLFDCAATLSKLLSKLVRSYGLDALDVSDANVPVPPSQEAVQTFLQGIARAEAQTFTALGEGEDVRLTGDHLAGGALIVEGRILHLSAFRLAEAETDTAAAFAPMSRASARRLWQARSD